MKELGPAEFTAATGPSVKALRLYDERAPLVLPVSTGPPATAGTPKTRSLPRAGSRCLRRAGIGRFLAAPAAAVIDRWLAGLAAGTALRRRALEALAVTLGLGTSPPRAPAMAVIIRPVEPPAELAATFNVAGAQFDPATEYIDQRRFAGLAAAYRRAGAGDDLAPGLFRRRAPVVRGS